MVQVARSLHKTGVLSELLSMCPHALRVPAAGQQDPCVSSAEERPGFADAELQDLPKTHARSLSSSL